MAKVSVYEQLDDAVQAIVTRLSDAKDGATRVKADARVAPLIRVAAELRDLPRENFRARLKSDLRRASMATLAEPVSSVRQSVAAYLTVKNAARAIDFYKRAFGAIEKGRLSMPSGEIGHAEIQIGGSTIMLSDEFPEYGGISPETLGGSPMRMHLYVDDVDAFAERAVAEGARITRPIADQFYGDRSGYIADPFGYTWIVATQGKTMVSLEELQKRFAAMAARPEKKDTGVSPGPKGYHTLTTYLVARDADGLIDFVTKTFGAEEKFRSVGSAGGRHAEVRIGDSMLMIGGGIAGGGWKGDPMPSAFHVYVPDCDAVYQKALAAGATSLSEPKDQDYGERTANVKDAAGNFWYIATFKGADYKSEGSPDVQPYLQPLRAEPVINFLKRAFGAQETGRYTAPDGVMHHTTIKIGDSALEMSEAQGIYQPMPTMFYLYVPNCDELYHRAIAAGAESISAPMDHDYGDRSGAVKDVFGNQWFIATHIKDVETSGA